jgi:thiol-disulfide isomerase/thioredoxin
MSARARNWLVRGSVTVSLVALLFLGWLHRDRYTPVESGTVAPNFTARSLSGGDVSLAQYKGQVVLLNLWATWCVPCIREMPALDRLQRQLAGKVTVLAVSVDVGAGKTDDFGNPGGDVAAYVKALGLTMPILLDPESNVKRQYGVTGLPTTFIIGRDGVVVEKKLGAAKWDEPPYLDRIRALAGL